jgi:hypothetical protein
MKRLVRIMDDLTSVMIWVAATLSLAIGFCKNGMKNSPALLNEKEQTVRLKFNSKN